MVRHQVGPDAKRKMIVSDLPDAECARTREPGRSLQRQKPADARNGIRPRDRSRRSLPRWTRAQELVGKRALDKRARAGTAFDVPFGQQLRVGAEYGNPRNSELIG